MKTSTILLLIFSFIVLFESINAADKNDNPLASSGFDQKIIEETLKSLGYSYKPSKAFTAVLMVYMVLIIVGAILVLVLIKPKIDK